MKYHHFLGVASLVVSAAASSPEAPSYRDELLSFHKELISIDSITGTEQSVGEYLADYFRSIGFGVAVQVVDQGRAEHGATGAARSNVFAWPKRKHPGDGSAERDDDDDDGGMSDEQRIQSLRRKVMVTSHIDVVPPYIPYGISDPADRVNRQTLITGRGSVDAKGSIAAQVVAVRQLLRSSDDDDVIAFRSDKSSTQKLADVAADSIVLAYVIEEETTGRGMKAADRIFPDAVKSVVFGEPTENQLACGHKGILGCNIRAHGVAAHSGYPWLGKSANDVLVDALHRIRFATDWGHSELFGNTTVNIGTMHGGVALNVVPSEASATLLFRIATGSAETGARELQAKLDGILREVDAASLELDCIVGYGVVETDCDVPGFDTVTVNYGTDIPHLQPRPGLRRYLYGPGSIHVAHSDHENLTVGDLEDSVEGYVRLIRHVLETSAATLDTAENEPASRKPRMEL